MVSTKGKMRDKNGLATKLIRIIVAIIFVQNPQSNSCETLSTQCFFSDYLKHKTVKKIILRKPSTKPHKLCANSFPTKSFPTGLIIFLSFQDFFGKVFLITLNPSLFDFSTIFLQEQCKKTV